MEFVAGGNKGNEDFAAEGLTCNDRARFEALVMDTIAKVKEEFDFDTCFQRHHGVGLNPQNLYTKKLANAESINSFSLLVAWKACLWDSRHIALAKTLAEIINKHLVGDIDKEFAPELKVIDIGY